MEDEITTLTNFTSWRQRGRLNKEGRKEGLWENGYTDSEDLASKFTYLNEVFHGYWESYHYLMKIEGKQVVSQCGYYSHGKESGIYKSFDSKGKLELIGFYL